MDLSKYYAEICKRPMLNREEEYNLFTEYYAEGTSEKRKNQIRETIISSNLRFVFKQAKYHSESNPAVFEDLIAAGNEGLLVGFEKYKPSRDVRYLSYAGWWVRQRMLSEMADMRVVSLPIWKQQLAAKIQKIKDSDENVTLSQVKAQLPDIDPKYIDELYGTKYLTFYLNDILPDPHSEAEVDDNLIVDPIGDGIDRKLDDHTLLSRVSSLQSPHREVIAKLFGLDDGEEYSPAKLARELGVPKTQIEILKKQGLSMLRQKF